MSGNLGVGGAANGTYAITSHSSGGSNLRLENDGEVGFIRLEDDGDLNIWAHGDENISFLNGTGSGTTRMNIDGSGRVTTPSQPAWRIGRGSTYTVTNGQNASTAINFNLINDTTRRFFTQGGITVSSGVVTVPVAGVYSVSSTTRLDGVGSGYAIMSIRINNDTAGSTGTYNIKGPSGFSSSYNTWTENTIFKLDASDTIRVYHYISNDASFDVHYISYFSGYLLG